MYENTVTAGPNQIHTDMYEIPQVWQKLGYLYLETTKVMDLTAWGVCQKT
jgi:hypothetical protein